MSTVFPFGAAICHDCRTPVAVVRRAVVVPCLSPECHTAELDLCFVPDHQHHHAVPDCAWTLVDAAGERHQCPRAA